MRNGLATQETGEMRGAPRPTPALNTIVQESHPQTGIDLTYISQSGDTSAPPSYAATGGDRYVGLDQFGRVDDQFYVNPSTVTSPTDRFQYSYDLDGNVLYKDVTEMGGTAATYSQLYHASAGLDSAVERDSSAGVRLYAQHDANMDVTALLTTGGTVVERFSYDPYGVGTVLSAAWSATSDAYNWTYRWQGGLYDLTTGLYSFQRRDYSPTLGTLGGGSGIPDEMLATVYNALDVFVLPTMAEGFGLPIMEAQACGVPALVTDFSACSELVADPIQRLKVKDTLVMHRNFEQAIVDVDDISQKLEHFYREREELEALGRRCHEFAQKFEWEIACGQFVDLIERTVASGKWPVASLRPANRRAVAYAPGAQERDRAAARGHERAGRLVEAEEACRRMLVRNPDDASALHLLGVVRGKLGDGVEAVTLLQRAIGLSPDTPAILNDLGVVHEDRGEFAEAAACYRRAVTISPGLHRVWVNLANALVQGGKAEEALQPCQEAIRLRPAFAPAHNAHGVALAELGRVDQARRAFEEAVRLRPDHAEAHCNLGLTLLRLGDFSRGWAEHEWRRKDARRFPARPGRPWDGEADLAGRSILLFSEGGLGNTIQFVRFAPVLARRGARVTVECQPALVDLLRTIEGIEVTTPAGPRNSGAGCEFHCPLMSVPAVMGRSFLDETRPSGSGTTDSLTLAARSDEADRGAVHRSGDSLQPWVPCPTLAWACPGIQDQHHAAEDHAHASVGHGTRKSLCADLTVVAGNEPRPSGSGPTDSLTLAARSDEADRGAVHRSDDSLQPWVPCPTLAWACPGIQDQHHAAEDHAHASVGHGTRRTLGADSTGVGPETQAGTPVPQRTIAAVPAQVPYLHPDSALVEHWAKAVREAAGGRADGPSLRIGVCWRGDQQRLHMRDRSFDPAFLAPLASVPGVTLISLQHQEPPPGDPPIVTLPGLEPHKMQVLDVAAAMKSLDLVVTCDTSIAHLAGALGVPVWAALKSSACWRWMLEREDSPWYPTMRLFRQETSGDWAGVFARMADVLSRWPVASGQWPALTPGVRAAPPDATDEGAGDSCGIGVPACGLAAKTQAGRPCYELTPPLTADPAGFSGTGVPACGLVPNTKDTGGTPVPRHSPLATANGYFGRAYVLNMDSDVERMAKASARLTRAGIEFERFAGLTPPASMRPRDPRVRAAHYACGLSHKAILLRALERGEERVLVFEDDVVLRDDAAEWMGRIVPQLQAIDWDIFYLGLHLEQAGASRGANLREVRRGFHSHAYGIARKAMARMAAHIDRVVADMAGTFDGFEDPSLVKVCAVPILAVQEPNLSYTFGQEVDRLGQYFTLFDGEDFRGHCGEMVGWMARSA